MEIHQQKVKIQKKKNQKKKKIKNMRKRVITFLYDKICIEWERITNL